MTPPSGASRVAIVTGSATGIGRAVAVALAKARFRIAVNYSRSEEEARKTAAQIEETGSECVVVQADVSNDEDCIGFARTIRSRWGKIDVLVNNAGFTRAVPIANLDQVMEEDWDRTFAVNVKGAFYMARACASSLREERGCIVNVSSTAGMNSIGSSIPYCASKAALNNLTLSLARALAPEVRVNAVLPGYVETCWNERSYGARLGTMRKIVQQQTPLAGVARPEHIAQIVCSIVGGMDWVTGGLIVADGGLCVAG